MAAAKTFLDFIAAAEGGMQSGVAPLLVEKNQVAFGLNLSLRGGFITHRPPIQKKKLNFLGNSALATLVQTGFFQGAGYYRPDFGPESLIAQIAGHLILFTEQGNGGTWNVSDVSVPGDLNNPSANQVWMNQAEKWMIITDGSSKLPIFFDGTTSRRSFGDSQLWGTTALDFTPPAIGGSVTLTLTAPYIGQYNVPVLLNGEYYQPISGATPGSYPAILTNISDTPSNVQGAAEVVDVIPVNVGYLLADSVQTVSYHFPYNVTDIFLVGYGPFIFTSLIPNLAVGTLLSAVDSQYGISATLIITSVTPTGTTTTYGVQLASTWSNGMRFNTGTLVMLANSTQPTVSLGTLANSFIAPAVGATVSAQLSQPYTGPSGQPVWINGAQYTITPVSSSPTSNLLTVINLTDTDINPVVAPKEILSVPELPAGRMGAYGMGRQWMSLTDGISYIAGDIVGGPSGSVANNYRDSVLKTTENTFLSGGGTFRLPGTGDLITAMLFPPILDTSLGQGELIISTPFSMFSNNSPVDRTTWEQLTSPLQTESLKDNGSLAQNSTILVNSDTFFRSYVGIGSLVLARRSFLGWGNKPISNEMQRILNQDNQSLLPYGSAITYDNRFLSTAAPNVLGGGVFHVGLVSLNFDLISTLRASQPPAWESVWTGINAMQVVSGRVNGSKRAFAFTYNINQSIIELYELLQETTTLYQDNDVTPILWVFETPVLFNKDIKPLPNLIQLSDGEFYISDIEGTVIIKVYYRPDFYPCWTLWNTQTVCLDNSGQYAQPGYRMRIGLGEPDSNPSESGNDRPLNVGNFFQFRVEITGSCKWHGLKVAANEFPQPAFAPADIPPNCQAIDCQVPDDLRIYSLQGLPPSNLPAFPPAPMPFVNEQVVFTPICASGTPTFSGNLPNWITLDADNNKLIGSAGVIGGQTQAIANSIAQQALNQFAQTNLANGNLTCGGAASCDGTDTHSYQITGYTDGEIANASGHSPSGGETTWDGTFPIIDNSSSCRWAAISVDTGVMLVDGKRSYCATIYFDGTNWFLDVWDDTNTMLWQGEKTTGSTAAGTYVSTGSGTDGSSPPSVVVTQLGIGSSEQASVCQTD